MKILSNMLVVCALTGLPAAHGWAQEVEEASHEASPEAFLALQGDDVAKLEDGFGNQLDTVALGAIPAGEFNKIVAAINKETQIKGTAVGDLNSQYDIIIQPGHYMRTTGRTGAAGKIVSERALVSYIVAKAATKLSDSGLKVLIVPADGVPTGIRTKVFLAVHADGAVKECKIGPSLSYSSTNSLFAMHAIGFGLARAFGYEYEDFMKDNYTVNEAKYYMFSKVNASVMEGLLEVGELSCDGIEKNLIEASEVIGNNVAASLVYIATAENAFK